MEMVEVETRMLRLYQLVSTVLPVVTDPQLREHLTMAKTGLGAATIRLRAMVADIEAGKKVGL